MSQPPELPLHMSGFCDWCLQASESVKYCSRCKIMMYCSAECQSKHWNAKHKEICKPSLSSVTENKAPKIQLLDLLVEVAVHLAMHQENEYMPSYLHCPIRRKIKKSVQETMIYLGKDIGEAISPPSIYDLSARTQEESVLSYCRIYGIGFSTIINRAVALAINTFLLQYHMQLEIEGRPVVGMTMYKAEIKLNMWTIVPLNESGEEAEPEPQEREHVWIGFKVKPIDPSQPTEDVYFADFNAISLGITNSIKFKEIDFYLVHGWSTDIRRNFPTVYRSGSLFRDETYMNRWCYRWPEYKNAPQQENSGPNLDFNRHLMNTKISATYRAMLTLLKEKTSSS